MANKYIYEGATYNGDGLSSAVASGATVTFTIATPGKVNWTGHGLAANALVYFGVTTSGALPTGITAGTTYYVRNPGTDDFEVSATSGGASIAFSGTPSGTATCTTTGAWNHIDILIGTAINAISGGTQGGGAVAAVDVVYMRSKTSAGADITITVGGTVNLGSSSATETVPITWILDNGVTWSGIDGTLTISFTGANTLNPRDYNRFYALGISKWVISSTGNYSWVINANRYSTLNWYIDTYTNNTSANPVPNMGTGFHINLKIKYYTSSYAPITLQNGAEVNFYNLDVELANAALSGKQVFRLGTYSGRCAVYGGRVWGAGATQNNYVYTSGDTYLWVVELHGVDVPSVMLLGAAASGGANAQKCLYMDGADGLMGCAAKEPWGAFSTRYDDAFPYLNAALPDSEATPWSCKLDLPTTFVAFPAKYSINKYYSGTAATKTITLEFLVTNTTGNAGAWSGVTPGADNCWMAVSYINNSTGLREFLLTMFDSTAFASSGADWSQTTYGSASFDKKKLSVTTPNAVKQDTEITVTFVSTLKSASTKDSIILCPDVQLT